MGLADLSAAGRGGFDWTPRQRSLPCELLRLRQGVLQKPLSRRERGWGEVLKGRRSTPFAPLLPSTLGASASCRHPRISAGGSARRKPRNGASATPAVWKAALPAAVFCDSLAERRVEVRGSEKMRPAADRVSIDAVRVFSWCHSERPATLIASYVG